MTLLKRDSGSAARVSPYAAAPVVPIRTTDPRAEELASLRRELARMEDALAEALSDGEAACADARAKGQAEGRAQSESREAERTAALRDGVAAALVALDERFGGERDLAAEIAHAALTAMIGDALPYRTLVVATAARHASTLAQGMVVRLNVSAADFPDDAALTALHRIDPRLRIVSDPSLAAGACRFDLTLGSLDAGVATQAAAVAALIDGSRG